ncbi:MAG: nucleoside deaminase [Candidatus Aminicenantaceae bacterium]
MQIEFMDAALKEARLGMDNNEGGPFGAVVVRKGIIIAKAHNQVIKSNDPTAHAEVLAIRKASQKLGRFDLSDCEIYSVSEPCPMCFAAIHWAKIKKICFGCSRKDAAEIGFDDEYIYDVIKGKASKPRVETFQIDRDKCLALFKKWDRKTDKTPY